MAFTTKIIGREALTRRLDALVPEANKAASIAKLEVVQELAKRVAARAPKRTGFYAASIKGERQADNPDKEPLGGVKSKDPDATALYADYIWKFLEYGTKASLAEAPRQDRRFKKNTTRMTKAKRGHAATPAEPHVMYTWKAYRKTAKAKIARAISSAVTASVKASSSASKS